MSNLLENALALLGIADTALLITEMPWEHEDELDDIYARLDDVELPDAEHPWYPLMFETSKTCRMLIGHSEAELRGGTDSAAHSWTLAQRERLRGFADRLLAQVDKADGGRVHRG